MKLVFQNANGHERVIANNVTSDDAYSEVKKFCREHDFHIYYTRVYQNEDGVTVFDVGSWNEKFKLYPDDKE
jgi:hypothetical protein